MHRLDNRFKLVNRMTRPLQQLGLLNPVWEKDFFLDRAVKKAGGSNDWGDPSFREGLDALLVSIKNLSCIHLIGEITLYSLILNSLVSRLRFIHLLKDSKFRHYPLNPPVIITGLSRSGTTFLHRLLSLDPQFYSFPLWELMDPYPEKYKDFRKLKTRLEIRVKNWLIPELDKKHYTRAETPEECILLLTNSFQSQLFTDIAPLLNISTGICRPTVTSGIRNIVIN